MLSHPGWKRQVYVSTGLNLNDYLLDGQWHPVNYRLRNDTSDWTYGGNNPIQQGPKARRYEYWPLDSAMGHLNVTFSQLLAFVDTDNPPSGSIDFDEIEIRYRNSSLVYPSNGGKLMSWPRDSADDPATLTDGWRHGLGRTWRSAENPSGPLEFVYIFENPVVIHTVQLHQNPEWRAKNVEVLVSTDGQSYSPVFKATLPEKGNPNPNFAFAIDRELSAKARYLKVQLRSGYHTRHWGLGEI